MDNSEQRRALEARIQKCIDLARTTEGRGSIDYDHAAAEMLGAIGLLKDLGDQEIAQAHGELNRTTEKLTKVTRRLHFATWILFAATIALFLIKAFEVGQHFNR
jgi:hypothetical protein